MKAGELNGVALMGRVEKELSGEQNVQTVTRGGRVDANVITAIDRYSCNEFDIFHLYLCTGFEYVDYLYTATVLPIKLT